MPHRCKTNIGLLTLCKLWLFVPTQDEILSRIWVYWRKRWSCSNKFHSKLCSDNSNKMDKLLESHVYHKLAERSFKSSFWLTDLKLKQSLILVMLSLFNDSYRTDRLINFGDLHRMRENRSVLFFQFELQCYQRLTSQCPVVENVFLDRV
jgi:hypothetical protein